MGDRSVMRWRRMRVLLAALAVLAPATVSGQGRIWAEATVNQDRAYAQESVVYTVRVFSPGNLQTVEITPPGVSGAALEELERGVAKTQTVQGRPHVVNEYHYLLTPMAAGRLEVGPTRLNVTLAGDGAYGAPRPWGEPRTRSVSLETRPVTLSVASLPPGAPMPLRYLDVQAHWAQEGVTAPGEPLTLTVVIKGMPTVGERLPSVAGALESGDFKVYPDRPQVDWKWGASGRELWGRRVETYTVVPTRTGALSFPAIDLLWWDTTDHREMHARVPERTVPVGADALARHSTEGSSGRHFMSRLFTEKALVQFVLPVFGGLALAFVFGWWVGKVPHGTAGASPGPGALRGPSPASVAGERVWAVADRWRAQLRPVAAWLRGSLLAPLAQGWERARGGLSALADHLTAYAPVRVKVWWCTRCASRESQPEGICRVVRRFACRHLHMSPNASLASIADRIIRERPEASRTPLRKVLQDLDDAAYAGRPLDLRQWKRDFRRWFARAFAGPHRSELESRRRGLPELNP